MGEQKSYYDILGVALDASELEIKKRYRVLVRRYHPDVATDKESAKSAFLEITEAYNTLINPNKRLIYDASLVTRTFKTNKSASASTAPKQERAGQSQSRPSRESTYSGNRSNTNYATTGARVQSALRHARRTFVGGQLFLTIDACREVIGLDPRNVDAHVLLGDVYRIQNRYDEAIAMYTIAAQLDPRNVEVQTKIDKLLRSDHVSALGEINERQASLRMGLNFIGFAMIGALLLWLSMGPGKPIRWFGYHLPIIDGWSTNLILVLAFTGILAGIILSVNCWIREIDDELIFPSISASGMKQVSYPIGLLLVILSLFNFYAAAGIYLIIGLLQESISGSIFRTFAATVLLTLAAAAVYNSAGREVLLFGGNVVFLALLLGWGIGDLFRAN